MATKYKSRKARETVISEEVAREAVVDLLDYYDIDIEKLTESESDGAKAVERALDSLTAFVMAGTLEIARDKDGKVPVTHHTAGGAALVYGEVTARAKLAMDRFKPEEFHGRIYAFMGVLCGIGTDAIQKMTPKDLGAAEMLGTVLMNA